MEISSDLEISYFHFLKGNNKLDDIDSIYLKLIIENINNLKKKEIEISLRKSQYLSYTYISNIDKNIFNFENQNLNINFELTLIFKDIVAKPDKDKTLIKKTSISMPSELLKNLVNISLYSLPINNNQKIENKLEVICFTFLSDFDPEEDKADEIQNDFEYVKYFSKAYEDSNFYKLADLFDSLHKLKDIEINTLNSFLDQYGKYLKNHQPKENNDNIILGLNENENPISELIENENINLDDTSVNNENDQLGSIQTNKNLQVKLKKIYFYNKKEVSIIDSIDVDNYISPRPHKIWNSEEEQLGLSLDKVKKFEEYNRNIYDKFGFNIIDNFEKINGHLIIDYMIDRLGFSPDEEYNNLYFNHLMRIFGFSDLNLVFDACGPSKYDRYICYVKRLLKENISDKCLLKKS